MKRGMYSTAAVAAMTVAGLSAGVQATTVDLASSTSKASISFGTLASNTGAYSSAAPRSGAYFLYRDGGSDKIQDLVQQTYFYRVGGSGAAHEVNELAMTGYAQASSSVLTVNYEAPEFYMSVTYRLLGTGDGGFGSTLSHSVSLLAKSGHVGDSLSLWSYSDYTLTGVSRAIPTAGDAYVDNNVDPSISQTPNGFEFAETKTVGGITQVSQWDTYGLADGTTISSLLNKYTTTPTAVETSTASALLGKLTSGSPDLTQSSGVVGGQDGNGEAIDVAFAAQWNLLLGSSVKVLSESSAIIPEPASLGMLALGASMLAFPRRRKTR